MFATAAKAVWAYLRSPQATRLEIALALGIYTAVRSVFGI